MGDRPAIAGAPAWNPISTRGESGEGMSYVADSGGVSGDMTSQIERAFKKVKAQALGQSTDGGQLTVDKATQDKLDLLGKLPDDELKALAAKYNLKLSADVAIGALSEDEKLVKELTENKPVSAVKETVQDKSEEIMGNGEVKQSMEQAGGAERTCQDCGTQYTSKDCPECSKHKGNALKKSVADVTLDISSIITSAFETALKRKGQEAPEPKPINGPPKQTSVTMPKEDYQEELGTTDTDAAKASTKVSQKKYMDEENDGKEERVTEASPESLDKANNSAKTKIKDTARPQTDIAEGKLVLKGALNLSDKEIDVVQNALSIIKRAQHPYLGEDVDDGKDLTVEKKNLGEVKLPVKKVTTTNVGKNPPQSKIEMPKNDGYNDEFPILVDTEKSHALPGSRKVTTLSEEHQGMLYSAKFVRSDTKSASYWRVTAQGKPIFAVSLKQAWGEGKEAIDNWETFKSSIYGKALVSKLQKAGAKRVIDAEYTDSKGRITVSFYKASQIGNENQGQGMAGAGSSPAAQSEEQPIMNAPQEDVDKIEDSGKDADVPMVELVMEMLAPVVAANPEEYDIDKVVTQLKDAFSDDNAVERFTGALKEKVDALAKELDKDGGESTEANPMNELHPEQPPVGEVERTSRKLTASEAKNKILELYRKIPSNDEGKKKLVELYNKIESENKALKAKVAKMEQAEYFKKKALVVVDLVKTMVKKGALKSDGKEYEGKKREFMAMSDKSLEEIRKTIVNLPDRTAKVVNANLQKELPVGDEPSNTMEKGNSLKGLFTVPNIVDEDTRTFRKAK